MQECIRGQRQRGIVAVVVRVTGAAEQNGTRSQVSLPAQGISAHRVVQLDGNRRDAIAIGAGHRLGHQLIPHPAIGRQVGTSGVSGAPDGLDAVAAWRPGILGRHCPISSCYRKEGGAGHQERDGPRDQAQELLGSSHAIVPLSPVSSLIRYL